MGKRDRQEVRRAPVQADKPVQPPKPPTISFDAWWAMTGRKLPLHHRKEVVKADFMARGLSVNESMGAYNKALEQYGVKLK